MIYIFLYLLHNTEERKFSSLHLNVSFATELDELSAEFCYFENVLNISQQIVNKICFYHISVTLNEDESCDPC